MDVELLAGERTGEKPERYDENLGQIPPPHARVCLQSFFFHSQKASMRLSSRASAQRERGICFSLESKAKDLLFIVRAPISTADPSLRARAARCARDDNVAGSF